MKLNNYEQRKRDTFDNFCRKNLTHEAKESEHLYTEDKYFVNEQIFNVPDFDVFVTGEKQVYVKGSKILVLYKYTYPLFLWDNLRPQITPQFYIDQITLKPAICNKQVAGFLLTKYLYFQPEALKKSYIFLHFFELDKPCLLQFLKYSLGCRSPPYFFDFLTFKDQKTEERLWVLITAKKNLSLIGNGRNYVNNMPRQE